MKPGTLSHELKEALGMPEGAPPPWLINMQVSCIDFLFFVCSLFTVLIFFLYVWPLFEKYSLFTHAILYSPMLIDLKAYHCIWFSKG